MNIIVSLLLAAATIAGGSIVWPKLTDAPRPVPLQQVHEIVKNTSVAKSFANVLGVSEDRPVEPINVASEASRFGASIMKTLEERAAKIVTTQAVRQLASQIGNLPPQEQEQIYDLLCALPTPTDSEPVPSP